MNSIEQQLAEVLKSIGVSGEIQFSKPPKPEMGDFAFACFALAKEQGKAPNLVASELVEEFRIQNSEFRIIEKIEAFGPYVNFFLNGSEVAKIILDEAKDETFGTHAIGKGKKYVIEFACPNPLKAFHLGHLKNLITGESVVRVFENAGYEVVRVNYQGDVGMHVAKALWGIFDWKDQFDTMRTASLHERVEFLGRAYAHGATHYEKGEEAQAEVVVYNDNMYDRNNDEVIAYYEEARGWSLAYFDEIYARLGSHFGKLYFESQMFRRGIEIVNAGLETGIFVKSDGAIIFEGSKHGLHDRVFINSKGFPTYEAKELALAEAHFTDYNPDMVIHVVGKEQTQYFEVLFKALEFILPESSGKEYHLIGGFLQLKGDEKMSSRTGNIVTGDQLIEMVQHKIAEIMNESLRGKQVDVEQVLEKVSIAALKYGMLKADVSQDVSFDLQESVSVNGDSGPYLLYIVARITSILRKSKREAPYIVPDQIAPAEKELSLHMFEFPEITWSAVESYDPSKISKYLFDLAQSFNRFYALCPVLQEDAQLQNFRLHLIASVSQVMTRGLYLLGIEIVEEM
ncbi:MAG: arginine--tRNA ligase [Candidatus Magasanikbacteria bacterium]|nr:arginine--tRNA ligase [Candidatus Magasanikbacteria bacterium]